MPFLFEKIFQFDFKMNLEVCLNLLLCSWIAKLTIKVKKTITGLNSPGEYTFPTGEKYVGGFKDGAFDGNGTMFYPSGTQYSAEWKDGKAIEVSHSGP